MILAKLLPIWGLIKRVPWQVWCGIAVVLTAWLWGNYREAEGRADERAAWEQKVEDLQKRLDDAMQAASEEDTKTEADINAGIAERRKELDNATADLPDQGLTDRQRARACAELRRQGREC